MTATVSPSSIQQGVPVKGLESVICNLCGQDDTLLRFPDTRPTDAERGEWTAFRCTHPGYGVHPPIVECKNCGLIYTNPRLTQDTITQNYEDVEDPLYLREREAREITFRHHLKDFERYTGSGEGKRLLDVGAYIGVFVEEALKSDWDAVGLEPSHWGVTFARDRGLTMIQGILHDAELEPESFDALTMWDVIEHLADPLDDLRHSYQLLKPGGWLAVHTMDIDSLFSRVMGRRWPWLMEMHIYFFSKKTLSAMIEKAGFEVVTVKPQGRYLRLAYLTTRLRPYSGLLADLVDKVAGITGLDKVPIPINFGDLVTAYARKPE